jgi:hypothetical protein
MAAVVLLLLLQDLNPFPFAVALVCTATWVAYGFAARDYNMFLANIPGFTATMYTTVTSHALAPPKVRTSGVLGSKQHQPPPTIFVSMVLSYLYVICLYATLSLKLVDPESHDGNAAGVFSCDPRHGCHQCLGDHRTAGSAHVVRPGRTCAFYRCKMSPHNTLALTSTHLKVACVFRHLNFLPLQGLHLQRRHHCLLWRPPEHHVHSHP